MLALAIRVEKMIVSGELKNRAHAAVNLGVSRARMTQILALALLAPDVQEEILFLEVEGGVERITERGRYSRTLVDRRATCMQMCHVYCNCPQVGNTKRKSTIARVASPAISRFNRCHQTRRVT